MPVRTRFALAALVAFAPVAPAHALVPHRIVAYNAGYVPGDLTLVEGDTLTLVNADHLGSHDLTAVDTSGGVPLFRSAVVGLGQQAPVDGVAALTVGAYEFQCSVHPYMHGSLNVVAAPAR
jgi:plastocyanin